MILTTHFIERVRSRIGPHVDARALGRHILDGIDTGESEFIGRVNRYGLRCFRFQVPEDGRSLYALVDTSRACMVTVLPAGFRISRQKATSIKLKEVDL